MTSRKTRGEVVKMLSRMQGVLGVGNDTVVALHHLEELDGHAVSARGIARGWSEAAKRGAAKEGERLLRALRKPKTRRGIR